MNRIALVVSDVDGTLLTKDKILTEGAIGAVRKLHEAGIGFTIISSRPTVGMRFLVEPLQLKLPFGAFNGSCIIGPDLQSIEQHTIPLSAAQRGIDSEPTSGCSPAIYGSPVTKAATTFPLNGARSAPIRPSLTISRPMFLSPARS
jgi:hydroxymethylpyrimidine pyrophosphatase-like HAD family hydrolase